MTRQTHRHILGLILLGGLGLAGLRPLSAADQPNTWTPIGPELSTVRTLAVAPSGVAYAATTQRGVFWSRDRGTRWSVLGPIPGTQFVHELVIDPGDPRGVYARTLTSIYYSRNGNAWQDVGFGQPLALHSAFAVAPSDPRRLYTFSSTTLQVSRDRGAHWRPIATNVNNVLVLRVDPRNPDVLFAGRLDNRVWKSTDAGRTWHETQWLGTSQGVLSVNALVFDPADPNVLYAGTTGNGIWKSTDNGETWTPVFTVAGPYDSVLALAVDPGDSRRIHAAVDRLVNDRPATGEIWRSEDAGAHWTQVLTRSVPAFSLAVDPRDPSNVYAGFEQLGVLKSADRGATWSPARKGLRALGVLDVDVDRQHPGSIWISAPESSGFFEDRRPGRFVHTDIFHTSNGGASWVSAGQDLETGATFFERIVVDPVRPERLWVLSTGLFYRSTDGGASWERILPLDGFFATQMVIDPTDPDRIYLSGSRKIDFPFDSPFVLRSLDGGDTWEELEGGFNLDPEGHERDGRMTGVALSPVRPETVYAGGTNGFFRSRNSGDSWTRISTDFPSSCATSSLIVDPFSPSTLYAINCQANDPVYKSTDNGAHWRPTALRLPPGNTILREILADPHRPGTIYVAGSAGIFVTGDGGAHWRPLDKGLPPGVWALALAADPRIPGRIYAATGAGLFALTRR
jgi:photosystem II stability/assembly factor-like uncharacterized protein